MFGLAGVDPGLASYVRQVDRIVAQAVPGVRIRVTSGYRSPQAQAELRRRWAMGDRVGITSEPAINSLHMQGLAVDLAFSYLGRSIPVADMPPGWFEALGALLEPVGVRRLGNHFELVQRARTTRA